MKNSTENTSTDLNQVPEPKFKIGEICILKNNLEVIIIAQRKFGYFGQKTWRYYYNSYPTDKYLGKAYVREENIEKLSDEQKVELL